MDVVHAQDERAPVGEVGDEPEEAVGDRVGRLQRRRPGFAQGGQRIGGERRRTREQRGLGRDDVLEELTDDAVGEVGLAVAAAGV